MFPHKVWGELFLKAFHGTWGTIYWGGCSTWGINDQIIPRMGEFHKYIFL